MTAPAAGERERPILFSAPMVRAILSGAKTQTRRVASTDPKATSFRWVENAETLPRGSYTGWVIECDAPLLLPRACPYGAPGDRLWVREAFRFPRGTAPVAAGKYALDRHAPTSIGRMAVDAGYAHPWCPAKYEADEHITPDYDEQDWGAWGKLRPGIHMPRWASRLTLRVTGVRVERVQTITPEAALAEGVPMVPRCGCDVCARSSATWCTADASEQTLAFAQLWDSINGKRKGCSWKDNPWVWVVSFEVVR